MIRVTRGVLAASLLASVAVAAVACGGDRYPAGMLHPNVDNEPPVDAAKITDDSLPKSLSGESLSAWNDSKQALLAAEPVLRLGVNETGPTLFGDLAQADVGPDGNIVVLDASTQEIRVFAPDGRFVDSFGGWGDGPMELRGATKFHLFPDGRVAVSLGNMGPIKVFRRSGGDWVLLEMIDMRPTPANSLCGMSDGRLFSGGYLRDRDAILNQIDGGIRSFGRGYRDERWLIRSAMSDGQIECLENPDRVVFGFTKLPIVRLYNTDGSLKWTASASDGYLQLRVVERQNPNTGAIGYSDQVTRDHDRLIGIHAVGSGAHLLVQYARYSWDRKEIRPRSYLVDAGTGAGAFLDHGNSLPMVSSVQTNGYIALFQEPYPHLEVRRIPSPETIGP